MRFFSSNVNRSLFFGFFFANLIFFFSPNSSWAEVRHYHFSGFNENEWGLGAFIGDPLALQTRYFTNWKRALSFTLGYASSKTVQGDVDYLFYGYSAQDKVLRKDFWNSLIFYGGPGVLTGVGAGSNDPADNFQLALRLVGGIEYIFVSSPWSMRMEAAPELFLKGKNSVGFELGLGATYYWWDGAGKKTGATQLRETHTRLPTAVRPVQNMQVPSGQQYDEFK